MVLIENTQPCMFGIGNLHVGESTPRVVALRPGVNQLEPHVWEALKNNPLIQVRIDRGDLRVEETEIEDPAQGLQGVSIRQTPKIIKNTFDVNLLNEWRSLESRPAVIKYIDAQLKLIRLTEDEEDELDSVQDEVS